MVLKKKVLQKINKPKHRVAIAAVMELGEQAVRLQILKNDPKLTQYEPLQVIKKIMEVDNDAELLTEAEPKKNNQ